MTINNPDEIDIRPTTFQAWHPRADERWAFKLSEMRHYLNEAHQFAAMSQRGKENIATAIRK